MNKLTKNYVIFRNLTLLMMKFLAILLQILMIKKFFVLILIFFFFFFSVSQSSSSAADVESHLERGRDFLARGQLQDALSHYHAAVGMILIIFINE